MKAIILGAGKGTRLRPLTNNTPKPLIKVNGKPIIERQIECLLEKGIKNIIIVTGYLAYKFNYLKQKYNNITLIYNHKYNEFNNIYTMYLVRQHLIDSYVLDGDIYINKNFIKKDISKSTYFGIKKKSFNNEWVIHSNKNKVVNIEVEDALEDYKTILSGISYWTLKDGEKIVSILENVILQKNWYHLYWDDIVKNNIKLLDVYVKQLKFNDCFEIDSIKDLEEVRKIVIT